MSDENGAAPEQRVQFTLIGDSADRLRRIAEQEGNPVSSVARRIFSVGLRHEPDPQPATVKEP